jgi:hypothetical protein
MLEFRLRVLDVREREGDPPSFLGIAEGFPEILVHATSIVQAERDLTNALIKYLRQLQDHGATRLEFDDFPTVKVVWLYLGPRAP